MAENQHRRPREHGALDRLRSGQIVDSDDFQFERVDVFDKLLDRGVMEHVLIPIRHHGAASIPLSLPDDVHGTGQEGVRIAYHGADVEIVLPILNRYVEWMATSIEIRHDRLMLPVAIAIDHIPSITGGKKGLIELIAARPWERVGTDAYFMLVT